MANEFSVSYSPGFSLYGLVFDPLDRAWNGTAFVDPAGVRPTCAVAMAYDGVSSYLGSIPSSVPPGTYTVRSYLRLAGAAADGDPLVGAGTVAWVGSGGPTAIGDLLGALVAHLRATPSVTAAFSTGFGEGPFGRVPLGEPKIFMGEASAAVLPPYLLIDDYSESLPGETLEDAPVHLTMIVVSNDLDEARTLGQTVKNAVDSRGVSDASIRTDVLLWSGGQEQGVMRNPSKPYRVKGLAKSGAGYLYREDIEYQFWVNQVGA